MRSVIRSRGPLVGLRPTLPSPGQLVDEHRETKRESRIVPRQPDESGHDRPLDGDAFAGLVLTPGALADASLPSGISLRQSTILPPPPEPTTNHGHDDSDSNRARRRQRKSFPNGINPMITLANMATASMPNAKKMAEQLRDAFIERAKRDFPSGLDRGWQRELERRTATIPGIALRQSMISNVVTGKAKAYRLDTLVRLRNYIGRPIDELLGLLPLPEASGDVTDERIERAVDRALERRARGSEHPSARSRVRKRG